MMLPDAILPFLVDAVSACVEACITQMNMLTYAVQASNVFSEHR